MKTKKPQKIAYSYVRFSTAGQAKGASRKRQKKATEKWCEEYGYELADKEFNDTGVSAYTGDNVGPKGALTKFLALAEDGTIKKPCVLVVENFDRFSRLSPNKSIELFLRVINSGIGVAFTTAYDTRPITAERLEKESSILLLVLNEAARAHEESSRKSRTVKDGIRARNDAIRNGVPQKHNNAPKFFTWDEDAKCYRHNEHTHIAKDIVDRYLAGDSIYAITKSLNAQGVPSMKQKVQWSSKTVRTILSRPYLHGEFLNNPNFFPPIISKEQFEKVQVGLAQNATITGKSGALVNIFRSLAKCSVCGGAMNMIVNYGDSRTKKKYPSPYRYLRCPSRNTGKTCSNVHMFRLDDLEDEFFAVFMKKEPEELLTDNKSEEVKRLTKLHRESQMRINALGKEIEKLISVHETVPVEELKKSLDTLRLERLAEQKEHARLSNEIQACSVSGQHFANVKALLENIDDNERAFDDAVRKMRVALSKNELRKQLRRALPSFVGKILIDGDAGTFSILNKAGKVIYNSIDV